MAKRGSLRSKTPSATYLAPWVPTETQECYLGAHVWSVIRLIALSQTLPVMEVPLRHLNLFYQYPPLTLREMAMHFRAVQEADLDYPVILDEDGELMDGRHRIIKALWLGLETIKAVRFDTNPSPCRIKTEED